MKKIIAMCGEPATGKTTIMRKFISTINDWKMIEPMKSLPCMYSESVDCYLLGKYEDSEVYAGTDRFSMSIQPTATEFVEKTSSNILFEGDRIFNRKFIDFALSLSDRKLIIINVEADRAIIDSRHILRKDDQTETFIKSRRTKLSNIVRAFDLADNVFTFMNNTDDQQGEIMRFLKSNLEVN